MIYLHRLNGKEFVLNAEQIKFVEQTPDTVITLVNDERFMVQESVETVVIQAIAYKRRWQWGAPMEPVQEARA